jgi:DMSO/TMAO reductase YedYZ molybdopterin-dependent catalytic subunit
VVPHLYFWKSAKWLQSIKFVAETDPAIGKRAAITTAATRGRKSDIPTIDATGATACHLSHRERSDFELARNPGEGLRSIERA